MAYVDDAVFIPGQGAVLIAPKDTDCPELTVITKWLEDTTKNAALSHQLAIRLWTRYQVSTPISPVVRLRGYGKTQRYGKQKLNPKIPL